MTILIIDDDFYIRSVLTEILEDEGYHVVSAGNGADALVYLEGCAELPQLILLDLTMPVMNGWEFRRAQRKNERLVMIPVVVVSADGQLSKKVEELAVADTLQKPISLENLLTTVAAYTGGDTTKAA